MIAVLQRLARDDSGQGLGEYALLVAFVAAMVAGVSLLWTDAITQLVDGVGAFITSKIPT
jgi:Flp pilus assembly pilin Flp